MRIIAYISLFILFPLASSFAAEGISKYSFLENIDSVSRIEDGKRQIILIGETHPIFIADEKEKEIANKKYSVIRPGLLETIQKAKVVYLYEGINRDPKQEKQYLATRKIETTKIPGILRGLEEPKIKAYSLLGTVTYYSGKACSLWQMNFSDENVKKASLEATRTAVGDLLGENSIISEQPLAQYWQALADDVTFPKGEVFTQLLPVTQGKKDMVDVLQKLIRDYDGKLGDLFGEVALIHAEMGRRMSEDNDINPHSDLPTEIFERGNAASNEAFSTFMKKTSQVREGFMIKNIRQAMKDFPDVDIFVLTGDSHRLPLFRALTSNK